MRALLRRQEGYAVATAVVLMTIMLGVGLSAFAYVDTQQRESGVERKRESSFNLSEGALSAQIFALSGDWPARPGYATSCSPAQGGRGCPDAATVTSSFTGPDYASGSSWTTQFRDNQGARDEDDDVSARLCRQTSGDFYDEATTAAAPNYDANRDCKLWVRSEAVVGGKKRVLVALVQVEEEREDVPENTITAGTYKSGNNGTKKLVDTGGVPVALRCAPASGEPSESCADYRTGQIWPETLSSFGSGSVLSAEALERMRTTARSLGTYYCDPSSTQYPCQPGEPQGCPSNPSGPLVFVERATGTNGKCSYNNSTKGCCNSPESPGALIIANGKFELSGSVTFYGLVYAANLENRSDPDLVSVTGNALIRGSIAVDGAGGVTVGNSGGGTGQDGNVKYDPTAVQNVTSFGTAGVIQNTWRELPAG